MDWGMEYFSLCTRTSNSVHPKKYEIGPASKKSYFIARDAQDSHTTHCLDTRDPRGPVSRTPVSLHHFMSAPVLTRLLYALSGMDYAYGVPTRRPLSHPPAGRGTAPLRY